MMTQNWISNIWSALTLVSGLMIWATGLVIALRQKSWKAIAEQNLVLAESWKDMATIKDDKIDGLEDRIANLESDTRKLREENAELRRLNLGYQKETAEMRAELAAIRAAVVEKNFRRIARRTE